MIYTRRNEKDPLGKYERTFAMCDSCGHKQETIDDFEMVRGVPPFGWGRKIENAVMQFVCPKCAAQQSVHPTCGDSAPFRALSTPVKFPTPVVLSTPPTSGLRKPLESL